MTVFAGVMEVPFMFQPHIIEFFIISVDGMVF
jgi:hypothetical protein